MNRGLLSITLFFEFQQVTFSGSKMWNRLPPRGTTVNIEGASQPAIVHKNGMVIFGNDGKMVSS